jgi:hypothetical protein
MFMRRGVLQLAANFARSTTQVDHRTKMRDPCPEKPTPRANTNPCLLAALLPFAGQCNAQRPRRARSFEHNAPVDAKAPGRRRVDATGRSSLSCPACALVAVEKLFAAGVDNCESIWIV